MPQESILGKGAFGTVVSCGFAEDTNATKIAMKIVRYQGDKQESDQEDTGIVEGVSKDYLHNELELLNLLNDADPLLSLKFYGCIYDESIQTLYIFQEQLEQDLKAFSRAINKPPLNEEKLIFPMLANKNFEQTVGLMFQMALGVALIHNEGYGHFDIKPRNFMITSHPTPVVKLIDYGISARLETIENDLSMECRGSTTFIDPLWVNGILGYARENDVFSLGITYFNILYGDSYCNLNCAVQDMACTVRKNIERKGKIKSLFEKMAKDTQNTKLFGDVKEEGFKSILAINSLIEGMIAGKGERIPLPTVIDTLCRLLREFKPDSVYLPENGQDLYDEVHKAKTGGFKLFQSVEDLSLLGQKVSLAIQDQRYDKKSSVFTGYKDIKDPALHYLPSTYLNEGSMHGSLDHNKYGSFVKRNDNLSFLTDNSSTKAHSTSTGDTFDIQQKAGDFHNKKSSPSLDYSKDYKQTESHISQSSADTRTSTDFNPSVSDNSSGRKGAVDNAENRVEGQIRYKLI